MEKEFYSVYEFAEIFGVSYRLIIRGISQGRIRAFRMTNGRRSPYRIHMSEINRIQAIGMNEINSEIEIPE